ncbi:MAG: hypothetical protein OXC68_06055 [Aestuariivita sp.]|nr:hypothetical protein [Aestuariivita sp.]
MKIVQPGMIATDFAGRRFDFANDSRITEYQTVISKFITFSMKSEMEPSPPKLAASIIKTAVTDETDTLRYHAESDAEMLLSNRKVAS